MEVHTTSIIVPSSSNEPSSRNSRRVCSQCNFGTSGPKGNTCDTCDRCLAYDASINPMDATTNGAYSKASYAENDPKDLKEVTSVAPAGSWPAASVSYLL